MLCDELDDRFAGLVGEVVPFGTRLVLVLPESAESAAGEAVIQLLRIGYENVAGYLAGGVDAWQAAGRPLRISVPRTCANWPGTSPNGWCSTYGRSAPRRNSRHDRRATRRTARAARRDAQGARDLDGLRERPATECSLSSK
ncbi:rhodanese-like domain-containing protein [Streptomyces sp. NPDC060064]|uniref:rhodanese-like domain-containing protein n=1 Tax=Streptomyces sp. NPDC060064 TaxID=3347049 RepID=UPI003684FD46